MMSNRDKVKTKQMLQTESDEDGDDTWIYHFPILSFSELEAVNKELTNNNKRRQQLVGMLLCY